MDKKSRNASIGIVGFTGAAFFGLMWVIAGLIDPSWVFGTNMVSDLGVSFTDAKYYFNYGSFISGILIMVAGIGIISLRKGAMSLAGGAIALAGVFLALVGLFPLDTGAPHEFFGISLFVMGVSGIILSTVDYWIKGRVLFGGFTLMMLVVMVAVFLTESLAYAEGIAVVCLLIWLIMMSFNIVTGKE